MPITIENISVAGDELLVEAKAALPTLNVGQSFVVPLSYANALRAAAQRIPGKFKTAVEDDNIRIGRVA